MKNRSVKGFTLIELLIVIAIIGILAAVLIPQLLGARVSANKKAIQAHSANVYKALQAALADNSQATTASIIALTTGDCELAETGIGSTTYGWKAAPGATDTCVMIVDAVNANDFDVTVVGTAAADLFSSKNGAGN